MVEKELLLNTIRAILTILCGALLVMSYFDICPTGFAQIMLGFALIIDQIRMKIVDGCTKKAKIILNLITIVFMFVAGVLDLIVAYR